jgi:hypothetical protein
MSSLYRLHELAEKAPKASKREALEALARTDPLIWSMLYRRLRGHPATYNSMAEIKAAETAGITGKTMLAIMLRHRPFLIDPLCDMHPHKVYKKGRQVGVSELSVAEALQLCDTHKLKWVYTFPRDAQLKDFSNTRIKEVRNESAYMANLFSDTDQVYLKRVGPLGSFLFFRSAWDANLGEGIDADAVTFDEKDRMREGVETAFQQSLKSSVYGLVREVSTPTIPNRGVDASFQRSDQRCWFVRCTKCNTPQEVRYPENVVQMKDIKPGATELEPGTYEYRCYKATCRGLLDRLSGEWVAKFPDIKAIRGYHIPQTIAPWISATDLMQDRIKIKLKQHWENYCLAMCSMGESATLNDEHFGKCFAGHETVSIRDHETWGWVTVGIDWGNDNWVVVLGHNAVNATPYVINLFKVRDYEDDPMRVAREIAELIGPMQPDLIVADYGYGKAQNAHLHRVFGDKFFACNYDTGARGSRNFKPTWNENAASVRADRTTQLKTAMQTFRDQQIGLPEHPLLPTFIKHFLNLVPRIEEDDGGLYEIIDSKGDDHFAHACSYAMLGLEKLTLHETGKMLLDFM